MTSLLDLWVASWRDAMPEIDFDDRRTWLADFLAQPLHETCVAEAAGVLMGFVTIEAGYLHQLVVACEAKGRGTASRLLDHAKQHVVADTLSLEVNQANARAVRFYRREGFVIESDSINPRSRLPTWRMRWTRVRA